MSLFKFVHSDSTKLEGNLREIMTFSRGSTSEAKNSFVSIYCFSSGEKKKKKIGKRSLWRRWICKWGWGWSQNCVDALNNYNWGGLCQMLMSRTRGVVCIRHYAATGYADDLSVARFIHFWFYFQVAARRREREERKRFPPFALAALAG